MRVVAQQAVEEGLWKPNDDNDDNDDDLRLAVRDRWACPM
jgi:hypothetical protein